MVALKLGMFGRGPDMYGTPPIHGDALPEVPFGRAGGAITAQPPKPGFFDADGLGLKLLGGISDGVLGANGMAPVFGPSQDRRMAAQQQQQQYQQRRQDEQSDWMARQQWEIAHPKPVNNDTKNDYEYIYQKLGKDAADQYLGSVAAGPPMAVDSIDSVTGNTVRQYIPRGQLPGIAPQAAPAQGLPQGFTVRPKGGAGQQAPRTFR